MESSTPSNKINALRDFHPRFLPLPKSCFTMAAGFCGGPGMAGAWRNDRMLLRIAAVLVALSLVAERAAGRSFPVRFLLLAILRRADAVATAFVAGTACIDWADLGEAPGMHGQPVEAAWLALRLRMLAAILCDLVDADCRAAVRHLFAGVAPDGAEPVLLLFFPVRPRFRPYDTS